MSHVPVSKPDTVRDIWSKGPGALLSGVTTASVSREVILVIGAVGTEAQDTVEGGRRKLGREPSVRGQLILLMIDRVE